MFRKIVLEFPEEGSEKDLREKEVLMKAKERAVMELLHKGKGRPGTVEVLHGKWIKKESSQIMQRCILCHQNWDCRLER